MGFLVRVTDALLGKSQVGVRSTHFLENLTKGTHENTTI